MGWKGKGLGKKQQGREEPIIAQNKVDRGALGMETEMQVYYKYNKIFKKKKEYSQELVNKYKLDTDSEEKPVEETPTWIECDQTLRNEIEEQLSNEWIVEGKVGFKC